MYRDKIEYLKRAIKRTYKRYTGERTDGKATLSEVAKFFNIPVDDARMTDYAIKKIDYNIPSIEIIDEKNSVFYTARYTGDADLLDFCGAKEFNQVTSISPLRKEESIYYIGSELPLITQMTFFDGEYELVFEKEMPNSVGMFVNKGIKMKISYLQNIVYNESNVKQPLLNKIYKKNYENGKFDGSFEQTYTYGINHFIRWDDTQDKYTYLKNNSIIYGINGLEQKGLCNYLYGICFENVNVPKGRYFPYNMDEKDYPFLGEDVVQSAMIFKCGTEDGIKHLLKVYKCKDITLITYHAEKNHYEEQFYVETIARKGYSLPNLLEGTITSQEIQNIIDSLQKKIDNLSFMSIASNELTSFGKKIDIRKGVIQEEQDPLSPKLFIDQPFDEIDKIISSKKTEYFKIIKEQFEEAINIQKEVSEKQKVLK